MKVSIDGKALPFQIGDEVFGVIISHESVMTDCKTCEGTGRIKAGGESFRCPKRACNRGKVCGSGEVRRASLRYSPSKAISSIEVLKGEVFYKIRYTTLRSTEVFRTEEEALAEVERINSEPPEGADA